MTCFVQISPSCPGFVVLSQVLWITDIIYNNVIKKVIALVGPMHKVGTRYYVCVAYDTGTGVIRKD